MIDDFFLKTNKQYLHMIDGFTVHVVVDRSMPTTPDHQPHTGMKAHSFGCPISASLFDSPTFTNRTNSPKVSNRLNRRYRNRSGTQAVLG
ncbi:hypothetical protein RSAG8_08358, partial [Rhizoctonia solani AG-8 WAC10335]